jgi:hypothetical protein
VRAGNDYDEPGSWTVRRVRGSYFKAWRYPVIFPVSWAPRLHTPQRLNNAKFILDDFLIDAPGRYLS